MYKEWNVGVSAIMRQNDICKQYDFYWTIAMEFGRT